MAAPSIVQITVSQQVAPTPSKLQKTGALISQGGTTLTAGTYSFLTQSSDLTALLASPLALTSLAWASGTVTATATAAFPSLTSGDTFVVTIAGAVPTGYNGTFLATVTGTDTFTYSVATDPGTETTAGTYTPRSQAELVTMADTFFGQGAAQGVYVLELGDVTVANAVTALETFIAANPQFFYSYLIPRDWDADADFLTMLASYEALDAKTYFFVTTTDSTYTNYTDLMKCVVALIEAPAAPITEFTAASDYYKSLNYDPSNTNRVTPFAFSYLTGVTAYPTVGNASTLTAYKNAYVNYVGTGAEGGISNTILLWGTTLDGRDFTYWYSVDWVQINSDLNVSNAIINGSNTPLNPLYYDQDGINRLQDVVANVLSDAIAFGLATGSVTKTSLDGVAFGQALDDGTFADQCVVNAVPFLTYVTDNPGDYKNEVYKGLSVVYIPNRGFKQISFNITATDFLTQ